MITVTLNFKTIEAARKALLEIPSSALVGGPEPEPRGEPGHPKIEDPKPAAAPAAASGKATAKAAAAPGKTAAEKTPAAESAEAAPPASTAATSSPAPAPAIEYTVLQKAVFTLAGKSREAAAAVAASFGVKTFKDLPADKWAAAFAAVNAKLAELESA